VAASLRRSTSAFIRVKCTSMILSATISVVALLWSAPAWW
jgi:hypothetical protein